MPTISEIQTCINNLTTASEAAEFAILATQAVRETSNNLSFSVATVADLPDLYTANIPNGQIVYVGSLGIPVVSTRFYEWLGLDGRLIRKDGFSSWIHSWGSNNCGQLGDFTATNRSSPVTVAGPTSNWCMVSAGAYFSAAIRQDGTAWTWGCNSCGQLGDNSLVTQFSPVSVVGGSSSWCAISAGAVHTTALCNNGTAWAWGYNAQGQLGNNTITSRLSPVAVVGGINNWCAISGGRCHTAAVTTDCRLYLWGANTCGRLGDNSVINKCSPVQTAGSTTGWCMVSAGRSHTSAVKTDTTLWTWGDNACGQLGDGFVVSKSSPAQTAGLTTSWCTVSSGGYHSAAVKTDGTLWTWGLNSSGQLGNSTVTIRSSPGAIAGAGTLWCSVSAGREHNVALRTDGTAWTWGSNAQGRLGDNTAANRSSPVQIAGGGSTWCGASASQSHTTALCTR